MLHAGSPAPGFELSDHTGRTVKLSDLLGKQDKKVLLWFYPKADTPG